MRSPIKKGALGASGTKRRRRLAFGLSAFGRCNSTRQGSRNSAGVRGAACRSAYPDNLTRRNVARRGRPSSKRCIRGRYYRVRTHDQRGVGNTAASPRLIRDRDSPGCLSDGDTLHVGGRSRRNPILREAGAVCRIRGYGELCTFGQNQSFGDACTNRVVLVCRHSHRSQNADDRDDDHQLDEGKTLLLERALHKNPLRLRTWIPELRAVAHAVLPL
jgi:hypothetical protein